jgi:hypothetical protein
MTTFWNKVYNVYRVYYIIRDGINYCRAVVDCKNNNDKLIIVLEAKFANLKSRKREAWCFEVGL